MISYDNHVVTPYVYLCKVLGKYFMCVCVLCYDVRYVVMMCYYAYVVTPYVYLCKVLGKYFMHMCVLHYDVINYF